MAIWLNDVLNGVRLSIPNHQSFQNRVLQVITNAPQYARKSTLYQVLNMADVAPTIEIAYTKLHLTMKDHTYPLMPGTGHLLLPEITREGETPF